MQDLIEFSTSFMKAHRGRQQKRFLRGTIGEFGNWEQACEQKRVVMNKKGE